MSPFGWSPCYIPHGGGTGFFGKAAQRGHGNLQLRAREAKRGA